MLSHLSHVQLFETLWAVAYQAPLSIGFSRKEYWSGLPCPPPGDLPDPGIKPVSPESPVAPALEADSLPLSHWESPLTPASYPNRQIFPNYLIGSCLCDYGEGNGNPLQYSCLENPLDGGAW